MPICMLNVTQFYLMGSMYSFIADFELKCILNAPERCAATGGLKCSQSNPSLGSHTV